MEVPVTPEALGLGLGAETEVAKWGITVRALTPRMRLESFEAPGTRKTHATVGPLRGLIPATLVRPSGEVLLLRTDDALDLRLVRLEASREVPLFERFGVRSLPQLLLVDGAGREVRRATPGIQPADAIRRLVGI